MADEEYTGSCRRRVAILPVLTFPDPSRQRQAHEQERQALNASGNVHVSFRAAPVPNPVSPVLCHPRTDARVHDERVRIFAWFSAHDLEFFLPPFLALHSFLTESSANQACS